MPALKITSKLHAAEGKLLNKTIYEWGGSGGSYGWQQHIYIIQNQSFFTVACTAIHGYIKNVHFIFFFYFK